MDNPQDAVNLTAKMARSSDGVSPRELGGSRWSE
jgi:hypothetical protein